MLKLTIDRFHMTSQRPYLCTKQWIGGQVCVQKNPVGIELFSHVKTFFYSKQFAKLLTTVTENDLLANLFAVSLVTAPEVFAKVNSTQSPSLF